MGGDGLTAGAVARQLGVAVTTLRTWHQRYGLGPSQHQSGRHRRYTSQDVERLRMMCQLTAQGVAAAEAAAWALRVGGTGLPAADVAGDTDHRDGGPSSGDASPADPSVGAGGAAADDGGRRSWAAPAARGLARAALRLDGPAMREILDSALAERGVVRTWNDVAVPVLLRIGERYEATRRYVEVEHLVSRCVTEAFGSVPRPTREIVPRVLLAAADEEQHTLGLEALAAALAEAGVPSRLLGARVPPQALSDAIARTGPHVVVLWAQVPGTADAAQLTRLAEGPRRPMMIAAAGPGWEPSDDAGWHSASVVRLTSLTEAVDIITAAVA